MLTRVSIFGSVAYLVPRLGKWCDFIQQVLAFILLAILQCTVKLQYLK